MKFQLTGADWRLSTLSRDAFAALVVFLLGLPLSVGTAIASGAPPAAGLLSAGVAGLICGRLGGASMLVTGPVIALTTFSMRLTQEHGLWALHLVTLAAGLLQLAFASLRLGRWALAIAPSVLDGMLAAVGLNLVTAQALTVLGDRTHGPFWANARALPGALANADLRDLGLAAATLAIIWLWGRLPWRRMVPATLVALVAASIGMRLLGVKELRFVEVQGAVLGLWQYAWPPADMSWQSWAHLAARAVELALICSVYTLLSAASFGRLHPSGGRPRLNRELRAQGLSNLLSGVLGGLPVSGAVLRSNANLQAGGATSLALFLQGGLMLLAIGFLHGVIRFVPLSALSAVFMLLGCQLLRPQRLLMHVRRGEAVPFCATVVMAVTVHLVVGVMAGLASGLLMLGARVMRSRLTHELREGQLRVCVTGVVCFLHVPGLLRQLDRLRSDLPIRISLEPYYADDAATEAIRTWCRGRTRAGCAAEMRMRPSAAAHLTRAAEATWPVQSGAA